jgi:hypothetical protein
MNEVKAVKGTNCIMFIGDNYKSDKFPYLVAEKDINGNYFVWQVDNENDWDVKNQYEILGSIPLNGLGQAIGSLQEQKYTEDDIRKSIAYGYELHHNNVWPDKVYLDKFIASLKK